MSTPSDVALATLPARLERAAVAGRGITFVGAGDPVYSSWAELYEDASAMAAVLQARGLQPEQRVAILGPTTRALVTAIEATWLAGATAVVLPLPMRLGSLAEFVAQTRARIRGADSSFVLVDPNLVAFLDPQPADPPIVLFDELRGGRPSDCEVPMVDPEALAILQFTSGSTAEPKGVMLPHRCVTANLDAITAGAAIDPLTDVAVSWLPLYHDMGLIGLLATPMVTGTSLVLAAPQDFLASPARWMHWMADYRGSVTAGPNFSYVLAARALGRGEALDLSPWRLGLNGAEPVDPESVDTFVAAGERHGLRPESVFPAFGMAEATLAVTFPEPLRGMVVDVIDRRVLETDRYAAPAAVGAPGAARLARLGTAVAGLQVRVVDSDSERPVGERETGEVQIRGTSVTPGYFRRPDATALAFDGEWLRTGDLGYLVDGELIVCGRIKDVIIVGGRNVFPEDIERAAATVEGVRPGNVIAFGVGARKGRGKEAVIVVAESRAAEGALPGVRDAVVRRVREAVGIPPEDVVLVAPGTLPKTSSGKLQRSLCRSRYLDEDLNPVV